MERTAILKTQIKDLCMEIIGLSYESRPDPMKILNRAMALANANGDLAREWAAQIAESEPELDGPMPQENVDAVNKVGIEEALRATVRLAKRNIARRIRTGEGKGD